MATGALDANGIWIYGEDDSETTFSALLNKLGDSTSDALVSTGKVIQVVNGTRVGAISTTSTSYVTANLQATITPKFATSRIVILVTSNVDTTNYIVSTIFRNSTNIASSGNLQFSTPASAALAISATDTPNTTSATTYSYRFRSFNGSAVFASSNGVNSFITVMEIGA